MLRREDVVHTERVHEPPLLVLRSVAGTGHGAGMADGPRKLRLPAPHDTGDDGFAEIDAMLVVAARLGIEDGGLAAVVVLQGVRKVARSVVDVDVLARRDDGRRAPPFGAEILRYRRAEAARIGEDRDRALDQHFFWVIAAKCPTDADAVPAVGHAEAIRAEDIDAVSLTERTDLARVMDGDLLRDDDDLLADRD